MNSVDCDQGQSVKPIVGIGELLWDVYPDGRRAVGGAPFNFAFHCQQLGHAGAIATRVGDDDLGHELREAVRQLGMVDDFIQMDPVSPTGTVRVRLDAHKVPTYEIAKDVAWDHIEWNGNLAKLAADATAVCYGTLAQRAFGSRITIQRLLSEISAGARENTLLVFDANLRTPVIDRSLLATSLSRGQVVKLSEDELSILAAIMEWPGSDPDGWVEELFRLPEGDIRVVILTYGGKGCEVHTARGAPIRQAACEARVVDTVGAGDAFAAAMVCLRLEGRAWDSCARFANSYAARVCEYHGATPRIDRGEVERIAFAPS